MLDLDLTSLFTITNGLIVLSTIMTFLAIKFGLKSIRLTKVKECIAERHLPIKPIVIKPLRPFIPKFYCNDHDWNSVNKLLNNISKAMYQEILAKKYVELDRLKDLPQHIIDSIHETMNACEVDYYSVDHYNLDRSVIEFIHQKFIELDIQNNIEKLVNVSIDTPIRLARAGYYEKDYIPDDVITKISNEVYNEQFDSDTLSSSSSSEDLLEDEEVVKVNSTIPQTFNEQIISDYTITNILPGTFITEVTQNILDNLIEDIPK